MKSPIWLAASTLLLTTPLGLSKTEVETLRDLCREQERQIRQLEEENMQLRSLAGQKTSSRRAPSGLASNPSPQGSGNNAASSYSVRPGDTLAKIARTHGTTVEALAKANGIKNPGQISVGQKIKIPGATAGGSPAIASSAKPSSPAARPTGGTHIVKNGDTFYSIAKKNGMTTDQLMAANPGVKASALRAGQEIHLSRPSAIASAPAPKPAASRPSAPAPQPKPAPAPALAPAPAREIASQPEPSSPAPSPSSQPAIRSITVNGEMTYGEFASKYGTDVRRLNDLNGLDLADATLLAKGSELYIPAQP